MNILVVEDEEQAAKRIIRLLKAVVPDAFVHGPLDSVEHFVQWVNEHPDPDLAFVDIHLSDGSSLQALDQLNPGFPLVFTTAYDAYALKAFAYNSVDYILKPINEDALRKALNKLEKRRAVPPLPAGFSWAGLFGSSAPHPGKKRFISRVGNKLHTVETDDIFFAYSENKATYLVDQSGKRHLVEPNLRDLEAQLDPVVFFRLNRQYLARMSAIEKIVNYSNSRLKVTLKHCKDPDIVLSRDRTAAFKKWIDT